MALLRNARARLRRVLADERGFAVPTALAALLASFGLASAAVLSTVNVQQGTHRDQDSKSAIAAADAGASLALLRLNRFQDKFNPTVKCVKASGTPVPEDPKNKGWCPAEEAETLGGASFIYQVSAYETGKELLVVATGTDGVVSRRVNVGLQSVNGKNVFADERMIGQDGIWIKGNVDIDSDMGTNGKVEKDGSSAVVCGNVRHGTGKPPPWKPDCGKDVIEGEKELPQISPPVGIATNNSNCRLVPNCANGQQDTWAQHPKNTRSSTEPWDATKKKINIGNSGSLTMSGGDYYICGLDIKGALIMSADAAIRIFIRKPTECGLASGAIQFEMGSQAVIEATGFETTHVAPQIYLLGNGAVKLDGGAGTEQNIMLYAPESAVEMKGGSEWVGMIAAKTLVLSGNPEFESDPNMTPPEISLRGLWQRTRYVECTGAAVAVPSENC